MTAQFSYSHRKGLAITFLGGFLLSFDIPLLRLAAADAWTVMIVRGTMLAVALFAYWAVRRLMHKPVARLINGHKGMIVSLLYGLSNIAFMISVHTTSTANLVFILAFIPMFTAILSWIFLREPVSAGTWATMFIAATGVAIIVWGSLGEGKFLGDILALSAALTVAGALVVTRWSGEDMSLTPALGSLISVGFALLVATPAALASWQWGWLGLNGLLIIPLASALLALGPRYLQAPEVSLFYLVETALAPVWVWIVFTEQPSRASLIGGTVIVAAIVSHSLYQLRRSRVRATGLEKTV